MYAGIILICVTTETPAASAVQPLHKRKHMLPWPLNLYQTAVGKKYVMAITGIGLLGFVIAHMIGNLHIYEGPSQLNEYAEALRELGGHLAPRTFILWVLRLGLITMFGLHIHSAYSLTAMSRSSSDKTSLISGTKRYEGGQDFVAASYASRTMRWTGPIIGLYILFHLADLTWGWWLGDDYILGDVYNNVVKSLSSIPVAVIYIAANVALALHIYHGAWSMFQTLGMTNPRYKQVRRSVAIVLALFIGLGNISFPILVQAGLISAQNNPPAAAVETTDLTDPIEEQTEISSTTETSSTTDQPNQPKTSDLETPNQTEALGQREQADTE